MSTDPANTTTGTPEDQTIGQPSGGAPPGADQDERMARSARRYAQMTDAERERVEAQFDGRVRDDAYRQAWCDAVDLLWDSEPRDAPPTERSAEATGAAAGKTSPESVFASFLNSQSEETRRALADAVLAMLAKLGGPGAAQAAPKPEAKDAPLNWAPLFDAVVAYAAESIRDGSAKEVVMDLVDETLRDAVRFVLDERGMGAEREVEPPGLYESVVEFARAAQSPGERLMWVRVARRLERDGQPGFVERMLTGWMQAKAERAAVASHAVRSFAERAYEFYFHRREEAARREADMRHGEVMESGKNLVLILGGFRDVMNMALGYVHGVRGAAPEQSASAQTTTGKPPAPPSSGPASGPGGSTSFS